MKKQLLLLFVLAFGISTMIKSQTLITETIEVIKTDVAPEIDGVADEAWDIALDVAIDSWGNEEDGVTPKPIPEANDFSASFKMMWDDEFVYLLGTIVDDILTDMAACADAETPDWETDNWEVYWAPTNTQLADMTEMIQVRFSYANAGSENACEGVVNGWSEGGLTMGDFVTAQRVDSDNGWVFEAKFDLAVLADVGGLVESYSAGDTIGFNINACDNDEEAARKHIGSVAPDAEWNQADTLPQIKLVTEYGGVGVASNAAVSNISIYPNPTTGDFNVSSALNVNAIEVVNSIGATVYTNNAFNSQDNLSQLCNGIYMVKLYSNNELLGVQKLVIK